jgi:hypothetical protein
MIKYVPRSRAMPVDNLGRIGMIAGLRPRAFAAVEDL